MASGYEDQVPSDDDAQREQLARIMAHIAASGNTGKYSLENLWALQGPPQFPPPSSDTRRFATEVGNETDRTPARVFEPDTDLYFPQAMPGNRMTSNPWLSTDPAPAPFHGKGEVIGPYELPKKKSKKKGKD